MTQKEIILQWGLSEKELRDIIKIYIDETPNVQFNWDNFLEYLKIEMRDRKLEYILPKN
jgi:hypothetical protein